MCEIHCLVCSYDFFHHYYLSWFVSILNLLDNFVEKKNSSSFSSSFLLYHHSFVVFCLPIPLWKRQQVHVLFFFIIIFKSNNFCELSRTILASVKHTLGQITSLIMHYTLLTLHSTFFQKEFVS